MIPHRPLPAERLRRIADRLRRGERVLAGPLAVEFGASEDAIRRDLRELAAQGLCDRVYGGAVPKAQQPAPFAERTGESTAEKAALASACAGLVRPHDVVLIDEGTTNLAIAAALPADLDLTLATNAPDIAVVAGRRGLRVVLIGGSFDVRSGGTSGAGATRELRALRPDLYFVGVCAVDPLVGLCAFDAEPAELKRTGLEVSAATAAAVTKDKIGRRAPFVIGPLARLSRLVVAADADLSAFASESARKDWIVRAPAGAKR